jgi:hypothetical protein
VPLKSNNNPTKEKAYGSSGTLGKDKALQSIQPEDSKENKKSNVKRPILIIPRKSKFKFRGPMDEKSHPTKKLKFLPIICHFSSIFKLAIIHRSKPSFSNLNIKVDGEDNKPSYKYKPQVLGRV